MNWLKRLFGIKTNFEIMLYHLRQSHAADLEIIHKQMATIDRVVAARYDRPTYAAPEPMQAPTINPADLSDVLTDGDDEAFFNRLEKL